MRSPQRSMDPSRASGVWLRRRRTASAPPVSEADGQQEQAASGGRTARSEGSERHGDTSLVGFGLDALRGMPWRPCSSSIGGDPGIAAFRSEQCLDSTYLNGVKIIFTAFGLRQTGLEIRVETMTTTDAAVAEAQPYHHGDLRRALVDAAQTHPGARRAERAVAARRGARGRRQSGRALPPLQGQGRAAAAVAHEGFDHARRGAGRGRRRPPRSRRPAIGHRRGLCLLRPRQPGPLSGDVRHRPRRATPCPSR